MSMSTRVLAGLAGLALIGGLAGCSAAGAITGDETTASRVINLTATDYTFTMPTMAPVSAGLVTIEVHNHGTQPHQANIARLHNGVTYDQFNGALVHGAGAALSLVDLEGGPNTVDPGATGIAKSALTAGRYVVLCFVQGADGIPHVAKGMVMPIQVEGTSPAARTPQVNGTIGLHSYGFDLPSVMHSGLYAVTNTADEPHELSILRVAPGRTSADVQAYLMSQTPPAGPPPFSDAGGVGGISPGVTAYGRLDLEPGDYVAICFVPDDQAPHLPHLMMGMFEPFTVR